MEPNTVKTVEFRDRSGFITTCSVVVDMSFTKGNFEKQYMITDYAGILLAIDDKWKTLRQIRKQLVEDSQMIVSSQVKSFITECVNRGWIEKEKTDSKHVRYRRAAPGWARK